MTRKEWSKKSDEVTDSLVENKSTEKITKVVTKSQKKIDDHVNRWSIDTALVKANKYT